MAKAKSSPKSKSRAKPTRAGQGRSVTDSPGLWQKIRHERVFVALVAVLLLLGACQSAAYWGHSPVPHFDFPAFYPVGHTLLGGELPSNYKRVPVVGLLQASLSHVVGGQAPELRAGWLINSLLHPLNIVLVFLVGRHLIGNWSFAVAVLYSVNPFTIEMLTQPIAETTLVFFILLSVWLIYRRSRWAYMAAAIASMTRYEGAALILGALLVDLLLRKGGRAKLKSVGMAALASAPLGFWLLMTWLNWDRQNSMYYLKEMGTMSGDRNMWLVYLHLTWETAIAPYTTFTGRIYEWYIALEASKPYSEGSYPHTPDGLLVFSQILGGLLALVGLVWAAVKREWRIGLLLVFAVPYVTVHVLHSFVYPRFALPYLWIILLTCAYGLQRSWSLLASVNRPWAPIMRGGLLVALIVLSLMWVAWNAPLIRALGQVSRNSANMASVAILFLAIGSLAWMLLAGNRPVVLTGAVALGVAGMVLSNQLALASVVGNAEINREFKLLTDWYRSHARDGEVLASTVPSILRAVDPENAQQYIHIRSIPGETDVEYLRACLEKNVSYIGLDSRIGLLRGNRMYRNWRVGRVGMLVFPQDRPPFFFLEQLQVGPTGRYVNVFRLDRGLARDIVRAQDQGKPTPQLRFSVPEEARQPASE